MGSTTYSEFMATLYFQVLLYLFALIGLLAVIAVAALWTSDIWSGNRSEV